jgi:exopolysaccharide biosynthesis polyprenyl glycosylphosphotransferase
MAALAAWPIAVELRSQLNPIMELPLTPIQANHSAPSLPLILFIWMAIIFRLRLYRSAQPVRFSHSLQKVIECTLIIGAVAVMVTFFTRQLGGDISRSFVLIFTPVSFVMLALARCLSLTVVATIEQYLPSPANVALLGDSETALRIFGRAEAVHVAKLVRGLIVPAGHSIEELAPVPVLGTTTQLAELINREQIERIILLNGSVNGTELESCHRVLRRMGVTVGYAVDVAETPSRVDLSTEYGMTLLEMTPLRFTRSQEMVKRIFDIVAASLLLIALAPVLGIIAALIKSTSKGPIFYNAPRVGRGGRHFTFLKFRSMYTGADRKRPNTGNEKSGHIYKIRNDPRITPLGVFLRRYSLDELPQLVNVLRGEMSLVGPRPLPSQDLDPDGMSREFAVWAEGRSGVHPGITGLWQISGRSDLAFEDMVRLDLEYIRNWSFMLDVKIILGTPLLVLKGLGAC